MTTPERFRRRQRIEGAFLIFLAFLMVAQMFYFHSKEADQRRCFENKVDALGSVLTARGNASEQESKATREVILRVANATTQKQVAQALHKYRRQQARIQENRTSHPLPPFPPGKCEDGRN